MIRLTVELGYLEQIEQLEAALDRYRYAVAYAAADAWDGGIDIRRRFEWARTNDPGGQLSNDRVAEIGKEFHGSPGDQAPLAKRDRSDLSDRYPGLSPDTIAKWRARAIDAIAEHRCATDLTDGFCGPQNGECRQGGVRHRNCVAQARNILAAIESRGMAVVWSFDKRRVEMPLFMCRRCGSVENTALSDYWRQEMEAYQKGIPLKPLCSACVPTIGQWHGNFERKRAEGYLTDGRYIYSQAEIDAGHFKDRGPFKPVELPPPIGEAA